MGVGRQCQAPLVASVESPRSPHHFLGAGLDVAPAWNWPTGLTPAAVSRAPHMHVTVERRPTVARADDNLLRHFDLPWLSEQPPSTDGPETLRPNAGRAVPGPLANTATRAVQAALCNMFVVARDVSLSWG